jgi:hypothetical protein
MRHRPPTLRLSAVFPAEQVTRALAVVTARTCSPLMKRCAEHARPGLLQNARLTPPASRRKVWTARGHATWCQTSADNVLLPVARTTAFTTFQNSDSRTFYEMRERLEGGDSCLGQRAVTDRFAATVDVCNYSM